MTQPFADALTWMPKSRALSATLTRAHDIARAQGHESVLLEHLLQSLIEDPDASAVLLACNIDLLKLNSAVANHLQAQPVTSSSQPEGSKSLMLILEYAAAAARQSKRSEVNGAIVLAAMVGEGKSDAALMLKATGLKFEDTIQALKKSGAPRASAGEVGQGPSPAPRSTPSPAALSTISPIPTVPHAVPTIGPMMAAMPAPSNVPREAAHDDDPLTTARRRVAALRSGHGGSTAIAQTLPAISDLQQPMSAGQPGMAASLDLQPWMPPPQPMPGGSNVRPMRMPPPIPAIPVRPPQGLSGVASGNAGSQPAMASNAPWPTPGGDASDAPLLAEQVGYSGATGVATPIDPTRLGEGFPHKMQDRVPVTVEVRIARSAILGTTSAMRASSRDSRNTVITRAVSVRLRAPAGGFYVETAAPETQWFDSRGTEREASDVRWRWVVTPQSSGTKPLLISLTIKTIAADGSVFETTLPEHQCSIRVGSNYRHAMRRLGRAAIAVSAGVAFTLLATGGLASVFGKLLK